MTASNTASERHLTIDTSLARQLRWLVVYTLFGAIALALLGRLLDGFTIHGVGPLLVAAASIAICQTLLWPYVFRFSSYLPAIVFPVAIFLGSALIILLVARLDDLFDQDRFTVANVETAIWISLGTTIVVSFLSALFSLDDRPSYNRMVTEPLRTKYESGDGSTEPGVLFLEIDGLAEPILEQAIAAGYAPTMKRWIEEKSHHLIEWEPDLSSQTSASQAGILLGSNENIPAFRWWDKSRGELMVSSSMKTARLLESELGTGRGLLAPHGSSRFNVFSGGAQDCVGTFSKLSPLSGEAGYWAYFANPYTLGRLFSRFVQEVGREWWEEFWQNRKNVQPRIARPWTYAFVRAGTTAALLELTRFMAIADIFRGVPSAYYTIFAYDEVAHHTGIDRDYTFRVLRQVDALLGHLEEVAGAARRPMHLVILSDHGQSQGATFLQRYGESLGDLVRKAMPAGADVNAILDSTESLAHFRAIVSEHEETHPRTVQTVNRMLENYRPSNSDIVAEGIEAVVLASGNLGLVSFPQWPERMTLQQIIDVFPSLPSTLTDHPGIGFIMVNDEENGGMVLSKHGVYFLDSDTFEGENPLETFGPLAAEHLRRTNTFPAAPDILVNGTYWVEENEVAAFEELVGCHGGLGGPQQRPFILHPTEFEAPAERIVGAGHVNRVLKGWIMAVQSDVTEEESASDQVAAS
ncbi:MAG: phage holin family protein [Thermomicrobiales bacterium]|nr:phage holin family protein [Thermomicrobiales bacterium]